MSIIRRNGNPSTNLTELNLIAAGKKPSKEHVANVQELRERTQLDGFKIEALALLGAHAMHCVVELDNERQALSEGDAIRGISLAEIQAVTISGIKRVLNRANNPLGF